MPNKRAVVGSAFAELGIGSWEFDLQPDEIIDGVNRLDQMMALWSSQGIRVGYNGSDNNPDADSGLPDVALEAVRTNLALRLAPAFGRQVNPITSMQADAGYSYLTALFMTVPQRRFPNTLPIGAGNRYASVPGQANFFVQGGSEVDVGPDSALGLNP